MSAPTDAEKTSMGFTVCYRSTRPVSPATADAVEQAADALCRGRTWLGCEPVCFFSGQTDGRLFGGSKPNLQPDPEDAASAAHMGLPDGGVRDLLDVLCRLSRDHQIDWEISHDHSDGPVGYIRAGVCDDAVLAQIEAFAGLGDMLDDLIADSEIESEGFRPSSPRRSDRDLNNDDDDDEGPSILSFAPR